MSSASKYWVVILHKSPRGPISTAGVAELIRFSQVGPYDVALEISSDGKKLKSDWQFLSRIEELKPFFEIASSEARTDTSILTTPAPESDLPEELLDISPDELLLKISKETEPLFKESSSKYEDQSSGQLGSLFKAGALILSLSVIFTLFVKLGSFLNEDSKEKRNVASESGPGRINALTLPRNVPMASPLSGIKPPPAPPRAKTLRPQVMPEEENSENENREIDEEDITTLPMKKSKKKAKKTMEVEEGEENEETSAKEIDREVERENDKARAREREEEAAEEGWIENNQEILEEEAFEEFPQEE